MKESKEYEIRVPIEGVEKDGKLLFGTIKLAGEPGCNGFWFKAFNRHAVSLVGIADDKGELSHFEIWLDEACTNTYGKDLKGMVFDSRSCTVRKKHIAPVKQ